MTPLKGKELERAACKVFICPNLSQIDTICDQLHSAEYFSDNAYTSSKQVTTPITEVTGIYRFYEQIVIPI